MERLEVRVRRGSDDEIPEAIARVTERLVEALRDMALATGMAYIVEASPMGLFAGLAVTAEGLERLARLREALRSETVEDALEVLHALLSRGKSSR